MKKAVVLLLIILTMLFTFGACGETQGPKTIRISFDTDGKVYVASMKVVLGEVPQIPETPQVEGYVFAGWYFDEELTNRYFFDYALEESATLYAKFYDLTLGEYTVISNVEQLIAIKDAPDAKYLLACDINCKGETLEPIETFAGELDGNGYKILNFAISKETDSVAFILTNEGAIKNLSFKDFSYTVVRSSYASKCYAVVCAMNKGTVENCHVLDSTLKITYTSGKNAGASGGGTGHLTTAIGGIAGDNNAIVKNCTNNAKFILQAISYGSEYAWGTHKFYTLHTSAIGGIVGKNNAEGVISECTNLGNFDTSFKKSNTYGLNDIKLGGCVGYNMGEVSHSYTQAQCDVNQLNSDTTNDTIGGFVGYNSGNVINSYSNMTINVIGQISNLYLGGFASSNNGKIYNAYSNVNAYVGDATAICSVGGFICNNELLTNTESLVSKCFAMGSIIVEQVPANCGYLAGANAGTIQTGVYSDALTISLKTTETNAETGESVEVLTALEPTCTEGEVKEESELLSVNFLENTLYFDRMIWFLVEGELPTLR